nr:SUF system Fe-S cluster assembly regulator [Candidatus Krumholzibacteria bacterium]
MTKLTDYGVGLMAHLANRPGEEVATAPDLSDELQLPLPTVRKILKILAKEDLLVSQRGSAGGYRLARNPGAITLMEMVTALEGPMALTECATGEACDCERLDVCGLRENWSLVNTLLQRTLENYTLEQMAGSLPPLSTPDHLQTLPGM